MVSVGPKFYLDSQNWQLKKGDQVTIKAFRGIEDSKGLFFASEVIRNGEKLMLRDKEGFSMWRRNLRRGPGGYSAYWGRGYGRGTYGGGRVFGRYRGRGGNWVRGWRCCWW